MRLITPSYKIGGFKRPSIAPINFNISAINVIGWDASSYPLTFNKVGSVWQSDFDRSDYLPDSEITTNYWVSTSGVNTNNGLSVGLPKRSIHAAITAGNATGAPFRVTVAAGTYYREDGVTGSSGTLAPTQDMILVASGGRVICPQGSSLPWPAPDGARARRSAMQRPAATPRLAVTYTSTGLMVRSQAMPTRGSSCPLSVAPS